MAIASTSADLHRDFHWVQKSQQHQSSSWTGMGTSNVKDNAKRKRQLHL
jgi:hypothetical protein